MWKQIKRLAGITLCNTFGWNEARFGKDAKKKQRILWLGCSYVVLCFMLVLYTALISYAYVRVNMTTIIPIYLFATTSLIILFFSLFKAGSVIFNMKLYERVIVLPVRPSVIIISRFLTMYVFDLALSMLVMIPGAVVYVVNTKPGLPFYPMLVIGIFLLPLLPMTIATAFGALILAVSSKVRHKNLVTILLSMILTIAAILGPIALSTQNEAFDEHQMAELSSGMFTQIGNSYPPAILFSSGVVDGNWSAYLLFSGSSLLVFAVLVCLVQWKFISICTALNASIAKRNYVMRNLPQNSPLKALYFKEIKRYFASSVYVINTSIGYIMMVVFSIAILVVGVDKIEDMLQMKGAVKQFAPLVLSSMCVICSTTSSSISIEGEQWWIIKSLPVKTKLVFDSKILVNLTIALPCYAVSACLLCFAVQMSLAGYLWLFLLPLLYILFSSVLGLTVNLKMPMFQWESEVVVVKQGAAVLVSMLIGFVSVIIPWILVVAVPADVRNIVWSVIAVVIALITVILYQGNHKVLLKNIN